MASVRWYSKKHAPHSRVTTGQKEPTDINALADEYLRLATMDYGPRTDLMLPSKRVWRSCRKYNVISQDIGRALLNLYTMLLLRSRKKEGKGRWLRTNGVSTTRFVTPKHAGQKAPRSGSPITVLVSRNDYGRKFFNRFLQPSQQAKALVWLSLSYDIITKGHGGRIKWKQRKVNSLHYYLATVLSNIINYFS